MPLILQGATSGQATVQATDAATVTLTLPATSGTLVTTGGAQTIEFADGSAAAPSITNSGDTNTGMFFPAADTIAFTEGGVESMRIDSSGNVGIGTSSPATKFQVSAGRTTLNANNEAFALMVNNGSATNGYYIGSSGANTLNFSNSSGVETMRIDSSGNLLVGTTASQSISGISSDHTFVGTTNTNRWICAFINSSASSPYGIGINYTGSAPNATGNQSIFFRDTGGTRFEVRSNGGIANFQANNVNLSDAREKTNFAPAKSYLDVICAIPVQTFNYIDQNQEEDPGLTLGVIAQDVQAVAPELVSESDWGTTDEPKMRLAIYQTDLQYALMKCIQEQQAIITDLKARIETLENT